MGVLYRFYYRTFEICARVIQRSRILRYKLRGYDVDWTTQIERNVNMERFNPKGVHIGGDTIITSTSTILAHRLVGNEVILPNGTHTAKFIAIKEDTFIGRGCVIGIGAIIMPGVRIGDFCIIGSGSIVTHDVPDRCIAVGNPAKITKNNIHYSNLKI